MVKGILNIVLGFSLLIGFSCDVTFNSELREYVNNIVERSPLDFTISSSEVIDDSDAINMGFLLEDFSADYTITNNENTDIKLAAFAGIDGDFVIPAFDSFWLKKGEDFTVTITFNFSENTFGQRVSQAVNFSDIDGRTYRFTLWATSKTESLNLYSIDREVIKNYDFGAWSDQRTHAVILKNEGLGDLRITNIDLPIGIKLNSESEFNIGINQEVEIELVYEYTDFIINNQSLTFYSNDTRDDSFSIQVFAGGSLDLDILNNTGDSISGDLDFGSYTDGEPITLSFSLKNNSLFDMDLDITGESVIFVTGLGDTFLATDNGVDFQIAFRPTGESGVKTSELHFRDRVTDRSKSVMLTGVYSPI